MLTLTVRAYAGLSDLPRLAELINTCVAVDQLDHYASAQRLQLDLEEPGQDPARDLYLWETSDGRLIAYGWLYVPKTGDLDCWLGFNVHPEQRHQGLEADILTWAEATVRQIGQAQGRPTRLLASARDHQHDRLTLLKANGFQSEREFFTMQRSLQIPVAEPEFPTGFRRAHVQSEADLAAWVEMYNATFIDHWQFHPAQIDDHRYWTQNDPDYEPELDLVAIAPDGTFAAFCYCHIDRDYNTQMGCNEGYISALGTRRGYRRMGLARAMLLTGLQHLRQAGVETAKLGVDTRNPNCAYNLYQSVGFQPCYTHYTFAKVV